MTTIVTLQVRVRPHGEAVMLDGQTFTEPAQLWEHLHSRASATAKKRREVRHSTFLTAEALAAVQQWERENAPKRLAEGGSGRLRESPQSAEELEL